MAAAGTAAGALGAAGTTNGARDAVPSNAEALVDANIGVLRRDDGMRTLADAALYQRAQFAGDTGPASVAALHADARASFDTDPARLHRVTAFGSVSDPAGGYRGVVLEADVTAQAIKTGFENLDDIAFDELRESGSVVYEPESADGPWVGSLPGERLVVGTEAAVHDAIDTANDEAASIGGAVAGAYTNTREAPVRFASRLPGPSDSDAVPSALDIDTGRPVDLGPLDDATTLSGAVYGSGDTRGLAVTLTADSAGAADEVATLLSELRDRLEADLDDDRLAAVIGDVAIRRDGATVRSWVEKSVAELESLTGSSERKY